MYKQYPAILSATNVLKNSMYGLISNRIAYKSPLLNKYLIPNQNRMAWVENNTLTVKIKTLLHTREVELDDEYRIIPLKTGTFNINVSIICEEYEEKDIFTIPIVINEE